MWELLNQFELICLQFGFTFRLDCLSWLMSMAYQHATVLIVQWNIQKRNRLACVQVEGITQRSWQVKQFLCLKMEIRESIKIILFIDIKGCEVNFAVRSGNKIDSLPSWCLENNQLSCQKLQSLLLKPLSPGRMKKVFIKCKQSNIHLFTINK